MAMFTIMPLIVVHFEKMTINGDLCKNLQLSCSLNLKNKGVVTDAEHRRNVNGVMRNCRKCLSALEHLDSHGVEFSFNTHSLGTCCNSASYSMSQSKFIETCKILTTENNYDEWADPKKIKCDYYRLV
ncbi:hypothetical protein GCK72_018945 [Caenorhabditis remanei]|uniref:Uncharacterized protein n=1 Tax=Caenorhabditis remanei TaxID=31234 RepID=A0A6A5GBD9_CAERE|nr:hypothetical protein GCK72_018945 [Caenorhabditis remanei]KAF1752390.1 hypothetical protein GCK72_018945 [Caenorhabditis remanei]